MQFPNPLTFLFQMHLRLASLSINYCPHTSCLDRKMVKRSSSLSRIVTSFEKNIYITPNPPAKAKPRNVKWAPKAISTSLRDINE